MNHQLVPSAGEDLSSSLFAEPESRQHLLFNGSIQTSLTAVCAAVDYLFKLGKRENLENQLRMMKYTSF